MADLRVAFTDLVDGAGCELVVPPGGFLYPDPGQARIAVAHPGCPGLADISVELDAFWCPECRRSGRVSGAWVLDQIDAAHGGA